MLRDAARKVLDAVGVATGGANVQFAVNPDGGRYVVVKLPVFPFERFPDVDPLPGPEMRSTGEVMDRGRSFGEAFAKAALATGWRVPFEGRILLSLADRDKQRLPALAARFEELGFEICATEGTAAILHSAGFSEVTKVFKLGQGHPDIPQLPADGGIQIVINTAAGRRAAQDAGSIRRAALDAGVLYFTTVPGAHAAAEAVAALRRGPLSVRALQDDSAGQPPWAAALGD